MRPYRDIATLAAAQILCFLVLTHLDPGFFLLHLYQTVIYMAILIMLFYMEDRWAYMIAILAPAVWLGLVYSTGLLTAGLRQFVRLATAQPPSNWGSLLAGVSAVLALLMIGFSARHWKREYAGLGKGLSTFLVSFGVVVVYYAILVVWFWNMIPRAPATP